MTYQQWRIAAEAFGLAALVGSLIFVGVQIRQDHEIALAELSTERQALFSTRFSAGLESDTYLTAYAKLYATHDWPTGALNETEIAAVEIDAMLWWAYLETPSRTSRQTPRLMRRKRPSIQYRYTHTLRPVG